MPSTIPAFLAMVAEGGSEFTFHRDGSVTPCPCLTPEGFRDPEWHLENPDAPVCNAAGMLIDPETTVEFVAKGFIQPVQSGAVRRLVSERIEEMFGAIEADDHLGIIPMSWNGNEIDFTNWSQTTKDYLVYDGRTFTVVSVNLLPDPADGNPRHHWEVGLRLISS